MKRRWLLLILAGIMSLGLVACKDGEESSTDSSSPDSSTGDSSVETPIEPEEEENPDYGLGDYENENEEDWWNNSAEPEEPEEPENSEISGETLPY